MELCNKGNLEGAQDYFRTIENFGWWDGLKGEWSILLEICMNNQMEIARWMAEISDMTKGDNKNKGIYFLPPAIKNNNLEMCKWVVNTFKIPNEELKKHENLLIDAYRRKGNSSEAEGPSFSRTEIVEWLEGEFGESKVSDIRNAAFESFTKACNSGQLEKAQNILDISGGLFWDKVKNCGTILYDVCKNDYSGESSKAQLKVAKWLVNISTMGEGDNRFFGSNCLICACKNGNLEMCKWLKEFYGLTIKDIRDYNCGALSYACRYGHLEVVKWLVDTFELDPDDAKSDSNCALRMACIGGHLEVAEWLVRNFEFMVEEDNIEYNGDKAPQN